MAYVYLDSYLCPYLSPRPAVCILSPSTCLVCLDLGRDLYRVAPVLLICFFRAGDAWLVARPL
jgi:hypothetical protein